MIVPAYIKIDELNNKIAATILDPYYKYYHLSYAEAIKIETSFWQKVQLVSLNDKNEVCGYFKGEWARPENYINSITTVNFDKDNPGLFARDIINFFKYLLFELEVKKIKFDSVLDNPARIHYDKLVENLGGRVIGIERYEHLINDKYHDSKLYEIINDRWECDNCKYTVKQKNGDIYRKCKKCKIGKMIYKNPFN